MSKRAQYKSSSWTCLRRATIQEQGLSRALQKFCGSSLSTQSGTLPCSTSVGSGYRVRRSAKNKDWMADGSSPSSRAVCAWYVRSSLTQEKSVLRALQLWAEKQSRYCWPNTNTSKPVCMRCACACTCKWRHLSLSRDALAVTVGFPMTPP